MEDWEWTKGENLVGQVITYTSSYKVITPKSSKLGWMLVCELIDILHHEWNHKAISWFLCLVNLPTIKEILLSRTKNVRFTVRSAYWVFGSWKSQSEGESSGNQRRQEFLESVFGENKIPNKVMDFGWRACRNIITHNSKFSKKTCSGWSKLWMMQWEFGNSSTQYLVLWKS